MERPYRYCTRQELGTQFAAAVRLGGRPVQRPGMQLAYADLALELILEEFGHRALDEQARELLDHEVAIDSDELPF